MELVYILVDPIFDLKKNSNPIYRCVKITNLGLETLMKTAFPHLSKLRKLELNFTR